MSEVASGWDTEQVVAALRRYVVPAGTPTTYRSHWPEEVRVDAGRMSVFASPADWLIGRAPWVRLAVRAIDEEYNIDNMSVTYGLLFTTDGQVVFLNEVAAMQGLGGRVGVDLDPIAYAEVVAELYSCSPEDGPVVHPTSVTPQIRAGELIRDVAQFHETYEFVDPQLVAEPQVRAAGGGVELAFYSCHYFLTGLRAIDVLRWQISCVPGRAAVWQREYVVKRLEARPRP